VARVPKEEEESRGGARQVARPAAVRGSFLRFVLLFVVYLGLGSVLLALPWIESGFVDPWTRFNASGAASLTQMLGVGTTTLVSHAVGRKDADGARRVFNQAQSLSLIAGAGFLVLGLALTPLYARVFSADAATAAIPVIFLTARVQEAEVARAIALGAAGCIGKPFDALALGTQVLELLGQQDRFPDLRTAAETDRENGPGHRSE